MTSSWRDGDDKLIPIDLSRKELHLIQRLRMLEHGMHMVLVIKAQRGRDGLQEFTVQEAVPIPRE